MVLLSREALSGDIGCREKPFAFLRRMGLNSMVYYVYPRRREQIVGQYCIYMGLMGISTKRSLWTISLIG